MPKDHMDSLYNSKNILVRFVHNQRLDELAGLIPREGKKILDAGCGEGHLIYKLNSQNPKNRYSGIDVTDIALDSAKSKCPFADIRHMDIRKLDFPDGYFDVVIASEVLEHIQDYKKAVDELKRVVKKDGLLIMSFPNEMLWTISRMLLFRRPIKVPDHFNSFNPKMVKKMIGWPLLKQINLPFKLPFHLSLTAVMVFKRDA